ncbi:MAG TPA: helix-turn-helix transcriptional regulator, partial [Deltaproteobacteria bacterium]|nr:helix-turn-helix transcriptional regulator [Deltaproteobacteria bacterium]
HRIVGARLRQLRSESNRTQQDLAEMLECPLETIVAYEFGKRPISVAELEVVCRALNVPLSYFLDKDSDIGKWHILQDQFELFKELPAEIREFVLKPINQSYLELAMKLAAMPAIRLGSAPAFARTSRDASPIFFRMPAVSIEYPRPLVPGTAGWAQLRFAVTVAPVSGSSRRHRPEPPPTSIAIR